MAVGRLTGTVRDLGQLALGRRCWGINWNLTPISQLARLKSTTAFVGPKRTTAGEIAIYT
jgi:hypothetical protein